MAYLFCACFFVDVNIFCNVKNILKYMVLHGKKKRIPLLPLVGYVNLYHAVEYVQTFHHILLIRWAEENFIVSTEKKTKSKVDDITTYNL